MNDEDLFVDLAARLKAVQQRVETWTDEEAKSSVLKHLRVITDASKHSLSRASSRLDALVAELDRDQPAS